MADFFNLLENTEPESWIDVLPEFNKRNVLAMKANGVSFEEMAALWVTTTTATTSYFSAEGRLPQDKGYIDKVKAEFKAFICGDKKYEKDVEKIMANGKHLKPVIVSGIAVAIAPTVGSSAVLLTPIIVLLLAALGKVSINAWCSIPNS